MSELYWMKWKQPQNAMLTTENEDFTSKQQYLNEEIVIIFGYHWTHYIWTSIACLYNHIKYIFFPLFNCIWQKNQIEHSKLTETCKLARGNLISILFNSLSRDRIHMPHVRATEWTLLLAAAMQSKAYRNAERPTGCLHWTAVWCCSERERQRSDRRTISEKSLKSL